MPRRKVTHQRVLSEQELMLERAAYALAAPVEALKLARRARALALADGDVRIALAASKYIATRCLLLDRWESARREAHGLLLSGRRLDAAVILGKCALGDGRGVQAAAALLDEELAATPRGDPDTERVAWGVLRRLGGRDSEGAEATGSSPKGSAPALPRQAALLSLRSSSPLGEVQALVSRSRSPWRATEAVGAPHHQLMLANDIDASSSVGIDLKWLLRMSSPARRSWRSASVRCLELVAGAGADTSVIIDADVVEVLAELGLTLAVRRAPSGALG